jgi:hypothetical protein
MATKKQKRAAGEARQAMYREESRLSGLRAQERDRKHREEVVRKRERDEALTRFNKGVKKATGAMKDMAEAANKANDAVQNTMRAFNSEPS